MNLNKSLKQGESEKKSYANIGIKLSFTWWILFIFRTIYASHIIFGIKTLFFSLFRFCCYFMYRILSESIPLFGMCVLYIYAFIGIVIIVANATTRIQPMNMYIYDDIHNIFHFLFGGFMGFSRVNYLLLCCTSCWCFRCR